MRILITAGPTREFLDAVRFLSNASSGRMGYALAAAARRRGHEVVLVSGPVALAAPDDVERIDVTSADEMLAACTKRFSNCDGAIAAAAVCDYRAANPVEGKIKKTGEPLTLEFVETVDVLAELGRRRDRQWLVGFAVEADDSQAGALRKLHKKNCDAIVLNAPEVIGSDDTHIQILARSEQVEVMFEGSKIEAAEEIIEWIEQNLGHAARSAASQKSDF